MLWIEVVDIVSRLVAIVAGGLSIWIGVDRIRSKKAAGKQDVGEINGPSDEEEDDVKKD